MLFGLLQYDVYAQGDVLRAVAITTKISNR